MTSDTVQVRIHKVLRDRIKAQAIAEGRTLEWALNEAIERYTGMPAIPEFETPIEKITKPAPEKIASSATPKSLVTASPAANLCKVHKVPLTVNGKCLMKGCKYA